MSWTSTDFEAEIQNELDELRETAVACAVVRVERVFAVRARPAAGRSGT